MTDDLLTRLQSAPEGSRALSDEMLLACGWEWSGAGLWRGPDKKIYDSNRPDPTRSLDDAVGLREKGKRWRVGEDADGTAWARYDGPRFYEAATVELAFCIAILKALAHGSISIKRS